MNSNRKQWEKLSKTQFANDPSKAGQLAAKKATFGELSRYSVAPVHTRFDAVEWFVWDADWVDAITGCPSIIRQKATFSEAVHGLE